MRDKDQILLEEALQQVDEGLFDRMKAKKGTMGANIGNKVLGGISKVAGDSRIGQAAGELQQQGQMDVEEKRAAQLTQILSQKMEKVYQDFKNDASKIGVDIDKLAHQDFTSKGEGGQYPALAGISAFLRNINAAKAAITKQQSPVE